MAARRVSDHQSDAGLRGSLSDLEAIVEGPMRGDTTLCNAQGRGPSRCLPLEKGQRDTYTYAVAAITAIIATTGLHQLSNPTESRPTK